MINDYLRNLEPGVFVALNISNYNKFPVIAKITHVRENEIEVEYLQGSYNKS